MLVSPFIDQHLCTILCLLDHILIISLTRFRVRRHHIQEPRSTAVSLRHTRLSQALVG